MKKRLNNITKTIIFLSILFVMSCDEEDQKQGIEPEDPTPPVVVREVGVWPISGSTEQDNLASTFGPRILSGSYDFHRGFDVRVPTGTPVHSVLDGLVVRVETGAVGSALERLGKFIVISHVGIVGAAQRQSVYLHLDEFGVAVGDVVKMGDVIGLVGNTGVGINTEHLHFEYHVGVNDGKLSRLNTRNPIRILSYDKVDYEVSATKLDHALTVNLVEDDAATDMIGLKMIVDGIVEKEINFETRAGINSSDEDVNPYLGLDMTPGEFLPTSEAYQLTFELSGEWANATSLDLEILDARDSLETVSFTF